MSATRHQPPLCRQYLLVLLAALLLYGISVAPGVLWGDSGLIQIRVLRHDLHGQLGLALSHPLYYLIAFAFQALPLNNPALAINLVSVVFGALTIANVYLLLRLLDRSTHAALIGAASLSIAHTFWQHAAMAEVYTLFTALLSLDLLATLQLLRTNQRRWLLLLFLSNGLGVSNHLLAILALPVWGILTLFLIQQRKQPWTALPLAIGAWLAGAAIYLAMIIGAWVGGDPLGDVIRSALFGSHYADSVMSSPSLGLLKRSILYLGLNFPTPTALLAFGGLAALRNLQPRPFAISLAVLFVIYLGWAVRYDVPDQYVFFIPSLVLIALLIGLGADRLLAQRSRGRLIAVLLLTLLPAVIYIPLPRIGERVGLQLGTSRQVPFRDPFQFFLWPWKTGNFGPRRFADAVAETLPPNAVLLADGTTVRPIHYAILRNSWRDDIRVFPRIATTQADFWPTADGVSTELAAGRVFVVSPVEGYCPPWVLNHDVEQVGVLWRILPTLTPSTSPDSSTTAG